MRFRMHGIAYMVYGIWYIVYGLLYTNTRILQTMVSFFPGIIAALLFGVYIGAPDFCKLPNEVHERQLQS